MACVLYAILQSLASMYISGALTLEELDSETIEELENLRSHPVNINTSSKARLLGCGLFSAYQAASIIDYRERNGDILSITELGLVDGFTQEAAALLKPFISLESIRAPGQRAGKGIGGSARARITESGYLAKVETDFGESAKANLGYKSDGTISACAAYYGRAKPWKIIAGAYNARYGQGLTMWNGMSLSGFSSVASFCRHATGLSASTSSNPSANGLAADISFGRLTLCAMGSFRVIKENGTPNALNLSAGGAVNYLWRSGEATACVDARSDGVVAGLSFRSHPGKVDLFGEAAWDFASGCPAGVVGIQGNPGWQKVWVLLLRYYSTDFSSAGAGPRTGSKTSDEAGASAGLKLNWFESTLDASIKPSEYRSEGWKAIQVKGILCASPTFKIGRASTVTTLRLCERYRPEEKNAFKTDLRAEADCQMNNWRAHFRWNSLWNIGSSWLWYAEGGYDSAAIKVFLRGGLFKVDNWDDRIYVYERDVPGAYNVPAYYGRGYNISLTGGWKILRGTFPRHEFNLRLSTVQYPWTEAKAAKWQCHLQYTFRL